MSENDLNLRSHEQPLLQEALARGAEDNATAVLMHLGWASAGSDEEAEGEVKRQRPEDEERDRQNKQHKRKLCPGSPGDS